MRNYKSTNVLVRYWLMLFGLCVLIQTAKADCSNVVDAAAISPDDKIIASGGCASPLKLWNAETGKLIKTIDVGDTVSALAFSADGKDLAVGLSEGQVALVDVTSKALKKTFGVKLKLEAVGVAFSPNHIETVFGTAEGAITIWSIASGKARISWTNAKATRVLHRRQTTERAADARSISSVSYSPDGKYILSGDIDGEVKLWNAKTGVLVRRFTPHSLSSVMSVAFAASGKLIASAGWDGFVRVSETESGKLKATFTVPSDLEGFNGKAHGVRFLADDKRIVIAEGITARINLVTVWEIATGKRVLAFKEIARERISSLEVSRSGRYVVTSSWDGKVRLWNLATGELIRLFPEDAPEEANPVAGRRGLQRKDIWQTNLYAN